MIRVISNCWKQMAIRFLSVQGKFSYFQTSSSINIYLTFHLEIQPILQPSEITFSILNSSIVILSKYFLFLLGGSLLIRLNKRGKKEWKHNFTNQIWNYRWALAQVCICIFTNKLIIGFFYLLKDLIGTCMAFCILFFSLFCWSISRSEMIFLLK